MNVSNRPVAPVVTGLIGACLLVFLLQLSDPQGVLFRHFALWPPLDAQQSMSLRTQGISIQSWPDFQFWQLFSYAFLHGGFLHISFNLFALWMFGPPLERAMGSQRFLLFYLFSVVGAALTQLWLGHSDGPPAPTVGASGGVLGLLPAFAILFPQARIQLLFPPVNMRAPVFVLTFAGFALLFGLTGILPGIAHFAHLGGMLSGGLVLLYWYWQIRSRR